MVSTHQVAGSNPAGGSMKRFEKYNICGCKPKGFCSTHDTLYGIPVSVIQQMDMLDKYHIVWSNN